MSRRLCPMIFLLVAAACVGTEAFVTTIGSRPSCSLLKRTAAIDTIQAGVEAFSSAKTAIDAGSALQTIYDALPHDDIDLDVYDPSLTSPAKLDAFREIYKRSKDPDIWNEENVQAFRALRAELDPLRTVDLAGYLSFAAFLGAAYYVAALAVQWFLPEIFPAVYVFLVFLFSSPIIYTFFFS